MSLTGALKEYIVNEVDIELSSLELSELMNRDRAVSAELRGHIPLPGALWDRVSRIGRLKYDLTFSRAAPRITDEQLAEADMVVSEVLAKLFDLKLQA